MNWLPVVVALLGSGGVFGSIYALLKLRPEAGQMTVATAQGVLTMQSSLMAELREQNKQQQLRIEAVEALNKALIRRQTELERQIATGLHRITELEARIAVEERRMDLEERRNTDIEDRNLAQDKRADVSEAKAAEHEARRPEPDEGSTG